MAEAILQAQCAQSNSYPSDYYDLVRELSATETPVELRRWAMNSCARRAALPRDAQAALRDLTLHQQALVRGEFGMTGNDRIAASQSVGSGEVDAAPIEPFRIYYARRQAERDAACVAGERDLERLARVRVRLVAALMACADDVTPTEQEALYTALAAELRRQAAAAIAALGFDAWTGAITRATEASHG